MPVRLFRLDTGAEVLALPGHGGPVNLLRFSPDGRRLASAGAGPDGWVRSEVRVHDAAPAADGPGAEP